MDTAAVSAGIRRPSTQAACEILPIGCTLAPFKDGRMIAVLGLGSNVGDRAGYLRAAVNRLSRLLKGARLSRLLEAPALLLPDAPPAWDKPFLNMALCGETMLSPQELMARAKEIERALGRIDRGKWGPREIDIDLLAMEDLVLESEALCVPHRELLNRDFALLPLVELAPDWRYPVPGKYAGWTARDIAADKQFALSDRLRDAGIALHG